MLAKNRMRTENIVGLRASPGSCEDTALRYGSTPYCDQIVLMRCWKSDHDVPNKDIFEDKDYGFPALSIRFYPSTRE